MKIKGRAYHLVNTPANHDRLQEYLQLILEAVCIIPGTGNGATNGDDTGVAIAISEMKLKRKRNPRGSISCITLTNVDLDREVAKAIELRLEQLLGVAFYIHTSSSGAKLFEHSDYHQRLDAVLVS